MAAHIMTTMRKIKRKKKEFEIAIYMQTQAKAR